jgi:tetratricopeptide (TPR) repeat protein
MNMKKNIYHFLCILLLGVASVFSSCSGYLDNVPKGQKIPTSLADFEAMLIYEYGVLREDVSQALILLNDKYVSPSSLSYYPLYKANYFWDTTADRVALNKADESTYYTGYGAISTCNLVIENAPSATDATETAKATVEAQARIIRAMNYFMLVNYYSKTYNASTASTDGGVPLITSSEVGASYTQPSVKDIYDFILNDITTAIPNLPDKAATILQANKGTAYAFAARVYLQMSDYDMALSYADKALGVNNSLYDWNALYEANKVLLDDATKYQRITSPMNYNFVENYNYRHGSTYYSSAETNIRVDRVAKFENGDTELLCRWKFRTVGDQTYYYSNLNGFFNYGGMTTTEVYLIKAECQARAGKISEAMITLNAVRKTRILASEYADLSATTVAQAIEYIRRTKDNAMILTIVPFCDNRRYNLETAYQRTLTKTENGTTYSLDPDSYMWTMPFPKGATDNPGNGTITQNVEK